MNKFNDLDALRTFHMAAHSGSIRAAAEFLGTSISTVSRRIHNLEADLGVSLLIRNKDGCLPTDVGRRIFSATKDLEGVLERINNITSSLKRGTSITITASDGIAGYWLPIILQKFPEDHPDITIDSRCRDVGRGGDLSMAETDVDVCYKEPTDPDVVVLGKATLPGRMFGSETYLKKHGYPRTMEDLKKHKLCILDACQNPNLGTGDWKRFANLLASHNSITFRTNSALALGFAIRSGWGLGSQPSMVEETEPGMVMLPKEVYDVDMKFWLVVHKDVKDNPAPRLLANWIKDKMIRSFARGTAKFETPF